MVSRIPQQSLQTSAVRLLNYHVFQSSVDRGIVYCETVDDATTLATLIDAPLYVGHMDGEARSAAVRCWLSGQSRWLCATSAFAQGIDYGYVTYVLHYRIPKHMTLYAQQSGRLSRRGGTVGVSHLLYSDPPTRQHSSDIDLGGFNAIVDLVTKAQCRRLSISGFLDSTPSNCHMSGPCQLCDFCAHHHVSCFPCHNVSLISFFIGTPSCCTPSASPSRVLEGKHRTCELPASQIGLSKFH
jgi:superfamily II DNA helicase RecQ